jgi:hypothetical protein
VADYAWAAGQADRLSAEFPAFHIALEPTADNRVRYIARGRDADVHPRMVITSDVAELHAALSASGAAAGLMVPCGSIHAATHAGGRRTGR